MGRLLRDRLVLPRAGIEASGRADLGEGPEDTEVQNRIRRILVVARLDVVLLVAIVFVMTAKPWL